MPIRVTCRCGKRLTAGDERRGHKARCPACGAVLVVQGEHVGGHDVFISYASEDITAARAVCATLEQAGVPCWMAPRDITPGVPFSEAIVDAIEQARVMVLVLSARANDSKQVPLEVERAVHHGLAIVPFRIENVTPAKSLMLFIASPHWFDAFPPPLSTHLSRLPRNVRALLGGGRALPSHVTESPAEAQKAPPAVKPSSRQTLIAAVLVSAALLVTVIVAGLFLALKNNGEAPTNTPAPPPPPADVTSKSIAQPAAAPDTGAVPVPQPASNDALYRSALQAMNQRQFDQAIIALSRIIADDPQHRSAYANRGLSYLRSGDLAAAERDFSRMIDLAPDKADGYSFRAQVRFQLNNFDGEIQDWSQVIRLSPTDPAGYNQRGQTYLLAKKDFAGAVADFSRMIELEGAGSLGLKLRGRAYSGAGDHQKAINDFTRWLDINSQDAEALYRRGLSYQQLGQTAQAQADAERALSIDNRVAQKIKGE